MQFGRLLRLKKIISGCRHVRPKVWSKLLQNSVEGKQRVSTDDDEYFF